MSENIMNQFGVGQDEFIFRMYSIALIAITAAAIAKGDMRDGLVFMLQPGTYAEQQSNMPLEERSWSTTSKICIMVVSQTNLSVGHCSLQFISHHVKNVFCTLFS